MNRGGPLTSWRRNLRMRRALETPQRYVTADELIALCDRGVVREAKWHDRDSAEAQQQLARCRALLLAGCKWEQYRSDDETIWLKVTYTGFHWFESDEMTTDTFYIPTSKRLDETDSGDWY